MIINTLLYGSRPGAFRTSAHRVVVFPVPLLFTAGLGVRASKPKPASNWPLPTLSLHAPCPRRTDLVAKNSLDQEFV
jgi:hypothetical protein